MVGHAISGSPFEVCGVLAGKGNLVEFIYRGQNVDASPVSYQLDPGQQLEIEKEMKKEGRKMLCIYHSHPAGPAYPSPKDVSLAVWDTVYIIIGLAGEAPEVRAFIIEDASIREAGLEIIDSPR